MKLLWRIACVVVGIICFAEGRSLIQKRQVEPMWKPSDGRNPEEWVSRHGMTEEQYLQVQKKMKELDEAMLSQVRGQNKTVPARPKYAAMKLSEEQSNRTTTPSETLGDFILTPEQVDWLKAHISNKDEKPDSHERQKRQLTDFSASPFSKWSMPIKYKFDGTQSDSQKSTIRDAVQHWSDNTCVRFREVETTADVTDNHLLFTSAPAGCYSYLGRVSIIPQQINLQDLCLSRFGTPVHEIGHSLGLWHQQTRSDRDNFISVNWTNIVSAYVSQFYKASTNNNVPYNYGSVMHYGSKDGSSANGYDTMVAKNPLYQQNMGQRTGLSYEDIKAINIAYCSQSCSTPLPMSCERGGYQDPNNCSRCICPDGFSGTYCQLVAESSTGNVGGIINLTPGADQTIKSPGYENPGYYASYSKANWLIKAPENYIIQLKFTGDFGIYCQYSACFHWVEVKYKTDLGLEGPRFCCNSRPDVTIKSESNEMMIVFKSNFSNNYFAQQRGFQAVITAVPISPARSAVPSSFSTTSTLSSTTTSSTTTTTTPSSTTTTTTTKRPEAVTSLAAGTKLWSCSFEQPENVLCGMTQDQTDQFDWTVFSGPTPSDPTGPDAAYDGKYYIYIEASDPRKPNDEARLFVPKFDYTGTVCIDFYYHMYGFHINTLKWDRITPAQTSTVWLRSHDMGNQWNHGTVQVDLSKDSRMRLTASRGQEFSGDIGVDAIRISTGPCPPA